MPDFFNGDVADLSVLPTWDGGLNSVNQSWLEAIDRASASSGDHEPDAVFVAGDMVEGRWNIDTANRSCSVPVDQGIDPESIAQCQSAIDVPPATCLLPLRRQISSRAAGSDALPRVSATTSPRRPARAR